MSAVLPPDDASVEALVGRIADEFLERMERGEQLDIEEYVRRHPHAAAVLRRVLPTLLALHRTTPPGGQAAAPGAPPGPPDRLGDFRILRELGRGGMGIVYLAVQESLGRAVALKILPFASTLDARQLQRFQNEAQAAALLHHQHIVPVYAVGCARDVHFYAMQFIEGQNLAALIAELGRRGAEVPDGVRSGDLLAVLTNELTPGRRAAVPKVRPSPPLIPGPTTDEGITASPRTGPGAAPVDLPPVLDPGPLALPRAPEFFRAAARLGIQAAEALEHAHQLGIVHRDVKPANLLLDVRGHLWVTDFGLAQMQSDTRLTVTGDMLGTIRYMSPEQATGRRLLIDHRTDVYSLGVTLYELLTLRPAFEGDDRQEVLTRVAFVEPPPPRRHNPAVPADLETVILKAMAKAPHERYATAQELADDLKRFLEDRPVEARRPTLRQRLAKWVWRHRALVATALASMVILLVLAVALLLVSHFRIAQEQAVTKQALFDAEQEQAKAERRLYIQSIARADLEWDANNIGRALHILDACEPRYRDWEWGYLKRLCQAELFSLRGHSGPVNAVAFHPDGKRLASASLDRTVKIWDLETGQVLLTLAGHREAVRCVVFSPDGRYLASGGGDSESPRPAELKVWEAATGEELLAPRAGTAVVWGVSFSPDGQRLAAATKSHVRTWQVATGKEVFARPGSAIAVAFSPDGKRLAVGTRDNLVKLLDATTGQELANLLGHFGEVRAVAFTADGKRLASASYDGMVKVWDLATLREAYTIAGQSRPLHSVAFNPNGSLLAAAGSDGTVRVWQALKGQEHLTLRGHTREVIGVAFSPGGLCLASASWDQTVKVWDVAVRQQSRDLASGAGRNCSLAFSPDSQRLAVAAASPTDHNFPGCVRVWDHRSGRQTLVLGEPHGPAPTGANPLAAGDPAGPNPQAPDPPWADAPNGPPAAKDDWTRVHLRGYLSVAFDPSGRTLATNWEAAVKLWDAQTGQELHTLPGHTAPVTAVAFSPAGRHLASTGEDQTVNLWQLGGAGSDAAPSLARTLVGHTGAVTGLAFAPDGARLASAGKDSAVKLWDVATGREVATLSGHAGPVTAVAFSPAGDRLASAGEDQAVRVWDAASGAPLLELPGHMGAVTGVAYHPGGRRLASASEDGSIRIWDADTGAEVLTLRRQLLNATAVAFSPDGKRLAAAQGTGLVKVWDAEEPGPEARRQNVLTWQQREALGRLANRQWQAALGLLEGLSAAEPDSGVLMARRARAHTELGQWDRAAETSARAVALGVDATDLTANGWYLAWLRVQFGDADEARRTVAALLRRFDPTADPVFALQTARICSLNPQAVVEPARAGAVAQSAVERLPRHPDAWETLGLAHYRAGDWAAAVTACAKAKGIATPAPFAGFVLAMAHWQQGDREQARRDFDQAAAWLLENPKSFEGRATVRYEVGRLRAEAAALLGVPDPPPPKQRRAHNATGQVPPSPQRQQGMPLLALRAREVSRSLFPAGCHSLRGFFLSIPPRSRR